MGGKIGFILIVIVILGVILYVYNAGTIGKGTGFLESLFKLPTSSITAAKPAPTYIGPPPGYPYATGPTPAAPAAPLAAGPYDIPAGFTLGQLSPYFHDIRLGGVSPGGFGSYGQISLYAYPSVSSTTIDVTGWQIKTNRGGEFIPQAVNFYDPLGGSPAGDIILKSGDYVNFYSTSGPVNLRLNKCIGYIANLTPNQFTPQLPVTCPYIDRSSIQELSGACQNYVLSLQSCRSPDFGSPSFPRNDYSCEQYLRDRFTYRSCYDEHRGDADFLSREVRVFMGASPVDQFHDRVLLLDRQGLLVDIYAY